MSDTFPFSNLFVRPDHPDFLDLPWEKSLSHWSDSCPRIVEVERGISRHTVVFVSYPEGIYAIKELPIRVGKKEYEILRELEKLNLPAVKSVGYASIKNDHSEEGVSILITKFLEALPYRSLFLKSGLMRYQEGLLNALSMLLIRLHLKGFFWGDCSLNNVLFRRDAGELQAYLVDAETSEGPYNTLSKGQRQHDLMIMEDNILGDLSDLSNIVTLPKSIDIYKTGEQISTRYKQLWNEITHDEIILSSERFRIHDRISRINQLGFTVDELELVPLETGSYLKVKTKVTERNFHRKKLHSLTGIAAEELQAKLILNEISELKATHSKNEGRPFPMTIIAHQWMNQNYLPTIERLEVLEDLDEAPEVYCQVLEHKWFLSEKAKKDIGLEKAIQDYKNRILKNLS
jgi:hypothetical protein